MGKRARKRAKASGGGPAETVATTVRHYGDGDALVLRDELSPKTLAGLERLDAQPAANAEDRWQRRVEYLFERLAVRWEIAGLPLESQKELLGRYRMASSEERRDVRAVLVEHLRERYPEVEI